jgi:O-antigen/teichoic acid export membrane protein
VSGRRLARDAIGLAASTYLTRAVLLARGLVAAIALGPAGFGAWNALTLVLEYGTYASAGVPQGLDLRLPAASARADAARERALLAGAWALMTAGFAAYAVVGAVAFVSGVPVLTAGIGPGPALLMLAAAGVQMTLQYLGSALRARERFAPVSQSQALQGLLGGGLGIALVGRFGLWGLAAGWLAGSLAALARLRAAAPDVPLAPAGPRTGLTLAAAGLPVFGFFLASLVLRSVDRIAFVQRGAAEALGLYSLGLMAAGLVLYLPEAVAGVLYPRITAATEGARDEARTRTEVERAQRALAVLLPLGVAIGMVWMAPAVAAWLPRYRAGVEAMRLLAFGSMLLSAATLPSYWLLGRGRARTLLLAALACAVVCAMLVFGVAARAPRPAAIASAACIGYGLFAVVLVGLAAPDLVADPGRRPLFLLGSLLPAAWAGATAFAVCAIGPAAPTGAAWARTAVVALAYLPVLWGFGRGSGVGAAARGWLARGGAA